MKGAVQTALMQNTPVFFFTNLHETKIISLRNSDNYENEKKKLKQKINFHKTDKLKEFFNHKLIIILIFFKGTVSGSGTGPLDYGATGPVPDTEPRL